MAVLSAEQASCILLACRSIYTNIDWSSENDAEIVKACTRIHERALADFREGMAKDFEQKFNRAWRRAGKDDLDGLARREQG